MNTSLGFFAGVATLLLSFAAMCAAQPINFFPVPIVGGDIDAAYRSKIGSVSSSDWEVDNLTLTCQPGGLDYDDLKRNVATTVDCFRLDQRTIARDFCCGLITNNLKCVCNETLVEMVPALVSTTHEIFNELCIPAISKINIGELCTLGNNTCAGGGLEADAIAKQFDEITKCINDVDTGKVSSTYGIEPCCEGLQDSLFCFCDKAKLPQSNVTSRCEINTAKIGLSCK